MEFIPKEFCRKLELAKPADYSFKRLKILAAIGLEGARYTRVNGVPERGPEKKKFLTKSLWLNNNKLKVIKNVDELAESVLEYPSQLAWIDFSFNYITEIDECILKFSGLTILYFHGNCISDLNEIYKLRPLKNLRSITFHGNPVANHIRYRNYVVSVLPQLVNLDFTPVVKTEKMGPPPPDVVRKLREEAIRLKLEKRKNKSTSE